MIRLSRVSPTEWLQSDDIKLRLRELWTRGFVFYCDPEFQLQKKFANPNPYSYEKIWFVDLFRDHESSKFSKIQPVFTNLTNPHESLVLRNKMDRKNLDSRILNPYKSGISDSICMDLFTYPTSLHKVDSAVLLNGYSCNN